MSRTFRISPGGTLSGAIPIPGDKSVSHRAIMLGAIAEGVTEVSGFLEGEDALATVEAFRAMGVSIARPGPGQVRIEGVGLHGLAAPPAPIDVGNSGTTMRLLAGLLAAQPFETVLLGDESLTRRPMRRVTLPLNEMGARLETAEGGTPPILIRGHAALSAIRYELPVASAQVKSALLLAGLYADGRTCIREPAPTRDHTERMLDTLGWPVTKGDNGFICIQGGGRLAGARIEVPADISSAAFFLAAAAMTEGAEVTLPGVGVNPTRTGILDILERMGAQVERRNERHLGGEPVADLRVRGGALVGIDIPPDLVPLAIDEFPAIFVAAACASGRTVLRGAGELRVKESDRIQAMADGLKALGVAAEPTPDGMVIEGRGSLGGGVLESRGDHRIAMALAMAGLRATAPIEIRDCSAVDISFPGFVEVARAAGLGIEAVAAPEPGA